MGTMHRSIDIFTVNVYNYNYYIFGIIPSYMSKLVTFVSCTVKETMLYILF